MRTRFPKNLTFPVGWLYKKVTFFGTLSSDEVALFLTDLGRFGNAVAKIHEHLLVSQSYHLGGLVIDSRAIFPVYRNYLLTPVLGTDKTTQAIRSSETVPRNLRSNFLIRLTAPLDPEVSDQMVQRALRTTQVMFSDLRGTPIEDNVLVVHFRAGDVFSRPNLLNYGQPPLTFYIRIIQSEGFTAVIAVAEDELNPCLNSLRSYCKSHGIKFQFQSGSFLEDVRVLTGARNLVAGRGSFVPAIAGISTNLRRLHYFEDKCNTWNPRSDFLKIRYQDSCGEYRKSILSQGWKNQPEQHEMMLTYPIGCITRSTE